MSQALLDRYFDTLRQLAGGVACSDRQGQELAYAAAIEWGMKNARATHAAGNKLIFVGNGGSAGISSHLAIDYTKNGGMRAQAFNDGAALTCLGNDLGYENIFAKQIEMHARAGDLLIAISSSGRSPNIIKAVEAARASQCQVMTMSGFGADNPLRRLGDVNFYVASGEYGFVEILHLTIGHAILDLAMGWQG